MADADPTTPPDGHALARRYAAAGLRVLPIPHGRKHPTLAAWQDAATTDADTIDAWWSGLYAGQGVGLAPDRLPDGRWWFAVDIDQHGVDGAAVWADLCDGYGDAPDTCEATTGGGGTHLLFAAPHEIRNGKLAEGVDLRGHGGQIVTEPTIHPSGRPYCWVDGAAPWERPIADAPGWLLALITATPEPVEPARAPATRTDRPGDQWAQVTTWAQLLEGDGWTLSHVDRTGEHHWVRPGKDKREGTSATTGYKGADVLKVFTTSHPDLAADATYTKLGYLAATRYDGDHTAAAADLRAQGYGDPTPDPVALGLTGISEGKGIVEWDEPWPEPVGFRAADPAPEVPVDALPAWVADQVRNAATQLGCDPMLPFVFGLGALSVASLGHVHIDVRAGETMRTTGLYVLAAGPPASGKSPALEMMFGPVRAYEANAIRYAAEEAAKANARRKIAAKEAETAAELAARTGDTGDRLRAEQLAAEAATHEDPPSGELITTDITPERVATLMAANAERAAIVSDEAGVLDVDRYGDRGGAKKLDIYLQGFTGQPVAVHRVKAPTVRLRAPLLAIVAGVQPEALAAAMSDDQWRTRGLGARFLSATTDVLATNTDIDIDLWDHEVGDRYATTLANLAASWSGWVVPAVLTIDADGRRRFSAWAGELRSRELAGDLIGEGGWVSKMRSSTLRIAALLHLADGSRPADPIADSVVERAIRIAEWFISHHTREVGSSSTRERRLLAWLVAEVTPEGPFVAREGARQGRFVARRDLSRRGPRHLRTKDETAEPLAALYEAGYVRFPGTTNTQVNAMIRAAKIIEVHPSAGEILGCATARDSARQTPGEYVETTRDADPVALVALVAEEGISDPSFMGFSASGSPPPRDTRDTRDEPDVSCTSTQAPPPAPDLDWMDP